MLDRIDSTIVAISSAPGYGVLGIVRLSGPQAIGLVDRIARLPGSTRLVDQTGHSRIAGDVEVQDGLSVPADFYIFRGPRSYTRQDIVEIHTIGSPSVLELVRAACLHLQAVPAEPGEFTARAFLHGAMDLTKAEAVAATIRAQTDTQLSASRRMMDGSCAGRINEIKNEIGEIVALVEADIDFAEEPIEFITPGTLRDRLGKILAQLDEFIRGSPWAERLNVLPHILLLGPPNAGKSSVMNRLCKTSRAICAAASGTTRDILAAPLRLKTREVILLDTAGVDASYDEILSQARALTLSAAEQVDLVCLVVDITQPVNDRMIETIADLPIDRLLVVANKVDLLSSEQLDTQLGLWASRDLGPICPVSAKTGDRVESLRECLENALGELATTMGGESLLATRRQQEAVGHAGEALRRAVDLCKSVSETIDCADVLAFELRESLDALGAVTGEVTTEDLLTRVFADFCIGK